MADIFFDKKDTPHGLANRIILYRYLQTQFARALNTNRKIGEFDITYLDAFSGTGHFENNGEESDINDLDIINKNNCPFDEYYGSPLVALEAFFKHITEQKVFGFKKALFNFIELKQARFEKLRKNVKNYIRFREVLFNDNQLDIDTLRCKLNLNVG